jgi:hypothetical protein
VLNFFQNIQTLKMSKTLFKKIKAKKLMIAAENKDVEFSDEPQNVSC